MYIYVLSYLYVLYPSAFMKHGITSEMLVGQPTFSVVFNRLLEWIKQCIKEACSNNDHYYPGKLTVYVTGFAKPSTYIQFFSLNDP